MSRLAADDLKIWFGRLVLLRIKEDTMKKSLLGCAVLCCFGLLSGCDDDSSGVAAECSPNETKCESNALSTCGANGLWETAVPCQGDTPVCDSDGKRCVANGSADNCTPNETKCESNALSTCDAEGHWGTAVPCKSETPVCDSKGKSCVANGSAGDCTPNDTKCESNAMSTCDAEGHWGTAVPCQGDTPVCDSDGKICTTNTVTGCTPNETKCESNALSTCDAEGHWGTAVPCQGDTPVCDSDGKICTTNTVTGCTPNETKCESNALSTCDSEGHWGTAVPCQGDTPVCDSDGKACTAAAQGEKCEPGETKCTADHAGMITCTSDGTWNEVEVSPCNAMFTCSDELNRCACTPGQEICTFIGTRSEAMYRCNESGDVIVSEDRIGDYCKCNDTFDACLDNGDRCEKEGERKCNIDQPMVCKNNKWENDRACTKNDHCHEELGAICVAFNATCNEGESVCENTTLKKCVNGLFVDADMPCGDNGVCKLYYCITENTEYGSRRASYQERCVNTDYCVNDKIDTCGSDGSVKEQLCAGESEICMLSNAPSTALPESPSVKGACVGKVCNEGEYTCKGEILSVCSGNKLIQLADCSNYGLSCKGSKDSAVFGCVAKSDKSE